MACLVFQGFYCSQVRGVTWRLNFAQGHYAKEVLTVDFYDWFLILKYLGRVVAWQREQLVATQEIPIWGADFGQRLWFKVLADSLEQYFRWNEPDNCSADFPK